MGKDLELAAVRVVTGPSSRNHLVATAKALLAEHVENKINRPNPLGTWAFFESDPMESVVWWRGPNGNCAPIVHGDRAPSLQSGLCGAPVYNAVARTRRCGTPCESVTNEEVGFDSRRNTRVCNTKQR